MNSNELRSISSRCNHVPELRLIPPGTLLRICSLKLQKRGARGKRGGVSKDTQLPRNGCNVDSLIQIKCLKTHPSRNKLNLNIGMVNVRSLKNKSTAVNDYIRSNDMDLFVLTQTWLKNLEFDNT